MRTLLLAGLLLSIVAAGCGGRPPAAPPAAAPKYESETEELGYLNSLANPTLEQWRRREALRNALARSLALTSARYEESYGIAERSVGLYRRIVERYPDTEEARVAAERLAKLAAAEAAAGGAP